jgi:hypothetical protein
MVMASAGCSSPRRKAERVLEKVGTARLREQAALMYKDLFAGEAPAYAAIKRNDWPALFRAFEPQQVGAYRDGFALALMRTRDRESGLYIIPALMDVEPRATKRSRFERIDEGVYWYSFER